MATQRLDAAVEVLTDVDGVGGAGRGVERHEANPAPRRVPSSGKTHGLAASRTASSTATPDGSVVGVVQPGPPKRVAEVDRDHHLGPVPADGGGDVPPQREVGLDQPVVMAEELDRRSTPTTAHASPLLLARAAARPLPVTWASIPASPVVTRT